MSNDDEAYTKWGWLESRRAIVIQNRVYLYGTLFWARERESSRLISAERNFNLFWFSVSVFVRAVYIIKIIQNIVDN